MSIPFLWLKLAQKLAYNSTSIRMVQGMNKSHCCASVLWNNGSYWAQKARPQRGDGAQAQRKKNKTTTRQVVSNEDLAFFIAVLTNMMTIMKPDNEYNQIYSASFWNSISLRSNLDNCALSAHSMANMQLMWRLSVPCTVLDGIVNYRQTSPEARQTLHT